MAQEDWTRWIHASLASYLKQIAMDENLSVLVEGIDERTAAFMEATDRAEIRITGPFTLETSKGCWQVFVDANVILTSRFDGKRKNAYSILKYAGVFHAAMDCAIGVWNLGGEPDDYVEGDTLTQVFLGCLTPRLGQSVQVRNFGQVDAIEKVKQAEVDCKYTMELFED